MAPLFLSDADFALIPMLGAYHSHAGNVSLPCLERISPMLGMVRPSHPLHPRRAFRKWRHRLPVRFSRILFIVQDLTFVDCKCLFVNDLRIILVLREVT